VHREDPIPALKQQVADELVRLMEGSSPSTIYFWIEIDQPRVSDLRRGRLERISLERLIRWLRRTGHVVELTIKRAPPKPRASRSL
jgi:predicted XRE-type DNA-binding protein